MSGHHDGAVVPGEIDNGAGRIVPVQHLILGVDAEPVLEIIGQVPDVPRLGCGEVALQPGTGGGLGLVPDNGDDPSRDIEGASEVAGDVERRFGELGTVDRDDVLETGLRAGGIPQRPGL